ncbi:hypothetical protein [Metabacillus litoralis]|uniref:hypothetical protein n=1 Tax=Metabacillus litoralis TaxID=152268 RepID=UPI00203AEE76|nr:hypothetical protein [Metabacillus litoralis]MCM3163432.1 hypothetical protein [Metabacillus litoralis]MCM3409703.1 hypothetical protein [Metabacillus litoralis]
MLTLIVYVIPLIILVTGLILYFTGRSKNNALLRGIGIGVIVSLLILETPDMIHGFIEGFSDGLNSNI